MSERWPSEIVYKRVAHLVYAWGHTLKADKAHLFCANPWGELGIAACYGPAYYRSLGEPTWDSSLPHCKNCEKALRGYTSS